MAVQVKKAQRSAQLMPDRLKVGLDVRGIGLWPEILGSHPVA